MRSLFLKVFLWFWLAMVLVIAALAAATYLTRPEQMPRPPQFIEGLVAAYARNAVETYEREGPSALDSFLQHVEREANIRSRLFDAEGKELAGREATADERELAARVFKGGETASTSSEAKGSDAKSSDSKPAETKATSESTPAKKPSSGNPKSGT